MFLPKVSLAIFHLSLAMRQAGRPHRTKPIGEKPTLISLGMSRTWICASNSFVCPKVVSFLYTMTSPERGMFCLSRPLMFNPTLSPGLACSARWWCISTVNTLPVQGLDAVVGWQENHFFSRFHKTLLHTTCKNIPHTFNFVNSRNWHPHGGTGWPFRHTTHLVQEIIQDMNMNFLTGIFHLHTFPPAHVELASRVFWFQQVVTHPSRNREKWDTFFNHVFLPTNFNKHAPHLIGDLLITGLLVTCSVAVHFVATTNNLFHTQQIDETRMLPGLTLNFTSLVVAFGNSSGEIAITWDHDHSHICLRCPSDHVLDEISVTWRIDDGVMPFVCEEFFGGACNGDTTFPLLFLPVHVKSKCKTALPKAFSLLFEFFQFTFRDPTKLKNQTTSGGALATVDMPTNDNRKMFLLRIGRHAVRRNMKIQNWGQLRIALEPLE